MSESPPAAPAASAITIRPARPADGPPLSACPPAPELGNSGAWFATTLARAGLGRGALLVAEAGGRVIGCGTLSIWTRGGATFGEIAELQVDPAWRGRGAGTRLVRALEAEAARLGAARVELGVTASNPRARALYARLGYRAVKTQRMNLGRGEEDVTVMERELTQAGRAAE